MGERSTRSRRKELALAEMLRIKARLDRLEAALKPAAQTILTIVAVASATGSVIRESQLVINDTNQRSRRTRVWA